MPAHSTLARLQQALVGAIAALAIGWLAWQGPTLRGWAGAAFIVFSYAIVLAIELAFLRATERAHPPATPGMLKAWWAETVEVPRVFGWRQPFRWRALDDWLDPAVQGRRGVVFLHGFICNRGFWTPWMLQLRARGHGHVAVNLEPVFGSIDDCVPIIDAAVVRVRQATGLPPVLVCHSMGGLAARAWLRTADAARIHHLVTIGTPHAGTWLARFSMTLNGRQMRRASEWLQQLERDEAGRPPVPTTCWFADCDNIVFPIASATRPGADNRLVRGGVAHVDLAFRPEVMQGTMDRL